MEASVAGVAKETVNEGEEGSGGSEVGPWNRSQDFGFYPEWAGQQVEQEHVLT